MLLLLLACTSSPTGKPTPPADTDPADTVPADTDPADTVPPATTDACQAPLFPPGAPWNRKVDELPLDDASPMLIDALQTRGWGFGRFQIDFGFKVLCDRDGAEVRAWTPNDAFWEGECDTEPVPVPAGGALESEDGYRCTTDGDCHLLVIRPSDRRLFEHYRVDIRGGTYSGGCLAVWDLATVPPPELRGEQCTSAEAAGLPIAPLLFSADEVAAGHIDHAIRFIVPNTHIRHRTYVRPATHATDQASAGEDGLPYGARLRLRADYPLASLPNDAARTIARALQQYGMILADGGNIALTATSDQFTTAKWADLLDSHSLTDIQPSDFRVVELGERMAYTGDCVRSSWP